MARNFAYVCFGILALAVAFHLGAGSVNAGAATGFVTMVHNSAGATWWALTETGELWAANSNPSNPWHYVQTIGSGVTVEQTTWGSVKRGFQ